MSRPQQKRERASEEQAVRCLRIVEYTYRAGSATLHELAELIGADPTTIGSDIAVLQHDGMRISVDGEDRYRIDQGIPGFSLRLRDPEASVAWITRMFCSQCWAKVGFAVPLETMSSACAFFESGLRKYYPQSEQVYLRQPDCTLQEVAAFQPDSGKDGWQKLKGQAKRVCKRLWTFDLIESGSGRRRDQLATLLGVSDRTIGEDLRIMRRAGLRVSFLRDRRSYWADSLHTHLAKAFSAPNTAAQAAALLLVFRTAGEPRDGASARPWCHSTSKKIQKSIRLIFKGREEELEAEMTNYGLSLDAASISGGE